jgi:hypothetical protein
VGFTPRCNIKISIAANALPDGQASTIPGVETDGDPREEVQTELYGRAKAYSGISQTSRPNDGAGKDHGNRK